MLERLFRSRAEVKVLGVVLFEDGLHLREIARRAAVSPCEAKKELENLLVLGVLTKEKRGNQLLFRSDQSCPFLEDLRNIYRKTEGVFQELKKAIAAPDIKYAFIFGSMASGVMRPASDIDLMVIGAIDENDLSARIFPIQKRNRRAINFILWRISDLKEKARTNSTFLKNIMKKDMVWLGGDRDEFIRIAQERPHKKS
jgi:predicted nucleotidyltransferase